MSDSDADCVQRLKRGDRDALSEFIQQKQPQLLGFIERNLSDALRRKVEPADILQETTISALGALAEIELEERDPFSWLCQLAERRIIDAHRKYLSAQKRSAKREVRLHGSGDKTHQQGIIDMLVVSLTTPSQAFSRGQRELQLYVALESLSEESRQALRLRYVDNLPTKEIARRLGKTDGSVRVLLSRSLARLQKILSEQSVFQSFRKPPAQEED